MLYHLGWRENHDALDVALVANRLHARGMASWWCHAPAGAARPGDYLLECSEPVAAALTERGMRLAAWNGPCPDTALSLESPRIDRHVVEAQTKQGQGKESEVRIG